MRWILGGLLAVVLAACGQNSGAQKQEAPASSTTRVESAADGPRLALVIGIGRYRPEIGALDNPVRDADLIANALQARGFTVTSVKDADRRTLTTAMNEFASALEAAGKNATGLIYFAGHGMQVHGVNYILPRDAEAPGGLSKDTPVGVVESALSDAFLPADRLLRALGQRENGVSILILDACRDNNLVRSIGQQKTRSALGAPRSLADKPLEADDMLIAYATGPGEYSYDGAGANSPFASALAEEIGGVGTAYEVLTRVRARVRATTEGKQKPLFTGALGREFCFAACDAAPVEAAGAQSVRGAGSAPHTAELLSGRWGSPSGGCDDPYQYAIDTDTLTITGAQWRSTARIGAERDGWLEVTALTPADMKDRRFSYRVEGATLTVQDGADQFTMQACR